MSKNNMELIRQALSAAESSIKLAKQLLTELEGSGVSAKPKPQELPGIAGLFDGENMVSENGQTFPVPANYASKSMLVVGDTLKLVEEGKEKRFKQIEHVKRHKTTGILTKREGKWKAVTPEGSYKVLPAAVAHFGADVGSEIVLHLPSNNLTVPYGAIESVKGAEVKSYFPSEVNTENENETKTSDKEKVVVKEPKVKDFPKEKKEELKIEVKKPEVRKVSEPLASAKVEVPKVETPKPTRPSAPKPETPGLVVKPTPKETVFIRPEPLKSITVEPETKVVVETPKPAAPVVAATSKSEVSATAVPTKSDVVTTPKPTASIEVSPEEEELT